MVLPRRKRGIVRCAVEVIELKAKKTASLDKVYRIVIETTDPQIQMLEKYIAVEPVVLSWEEVK